VTFVEGDVVLELPPLPRRGSASDGDLRQASAPARSFHLLRPETIVRLAANSRATVVCFNNRALSLLGPLVARITGQRCQSGTLLPANASGRVKPDAGRIRSAGGSLALEGEAREKEGDYGRIPIILSPRNTSLLEPAPALEWVEVPGAIEYVAHLSGRTAFKDLTLDAQELTCADDPRTAPGRVCSAPWPAAEWRLAPAQEYFLTVAARLNVASDLRPAEGSRLELLAAETSAGVRAEVAAIQALELDPVTSDLLLAGLYAEHKLYGQAISAYESALATQPAAVLYVTLGDLYRQIELYRFAFNAYRKALALLAGGEEDPAVAAAAEFGLGQVYYAYAGNYAEAKSHYAEAVRLYEQLGAAEELKAAQEGLKAATERAP
jgi:tetratricopeptide (TPR) repeat protein